MTLTLFPDLMRPAGARPTRHRAPRPPKISPPTPHNLWSDPPTPVPIRTPVGTRNLWGEWRNPDAYELHGIRAALELLPTDYQHSAGYLRRNRPTSIGAGLAFWRSPLSRAHVINVLLTRDGRPIKRVEHDIGMDKDDLGEALKRWGIQFTVSAARGQVTDPYDQQVYAAHVLVRHANGTATLRIDGYTHTVTARYDMQAQTWRSLTVIHVTAQHAVPYPVAATLAGVSPRILLAAMPPALHTDQNRPLLPLATLDRVLPREKWRMPLARAFAMHNGCHCAFWDDQRGRCHFKNPEPAAPTTCPDHAPLTLE